MIWTGLTSCADLSIVRIFNESEETFDLPILIQTSGYVFEKQIEK